MTEMVRSIQISGVDRALLDVRYGRPELLAAAMLRFSEASLFDNQNNTRPAKATATYPNIVTMIMFNLREE
jgi:hypothetical protein